MKTTKTITCQPVNLSESQAREQVTKEPTERLRSLLSSREIIHGTLKYKPFYAFPVELRKRVMWGEDIVTGGRIIVDGMTDISRPFTEESIEEGEQEVETDRLIDPDVRVDEALVTAKSRKMQVEHRERGQITMEETPEQVYKPVWIFGLDSADMRVVDATDGTVFSDLLLG